MAFLTVALYSEKAAHSDTKSKFADYRTEVTNNARKMESEFRTTENEWRKRVDKTNEEWDGKYAALNNGYVRLAGTSRRVRDDYAAFIEYHRSRALTASTPADREATAKAIDLLAELHRQLGERTTTLVQYADRASLAGAQCERTYEETK